MSASISIPSTGFDRFELHESLMRGIHAAGFENPRPIQEETIPAGLDGRDVLGLAQTGTGKTAAFALPLLDQLLDVRAKGPRALILAPTRELATQISDEIRVLSKFTRLKMMTIFGGVSMRGQVNALRSHPEIVVGCPGRVLDLLRQGVLRLDWIETLVLDEADHMFDMGFLPDIRRILSKMPSDRQNLLFSATMPKEIRRLADDLLSDPHVVELADKTPASTIDHTLYPVSEKRKRDLLDSILEKNECDSAIVFTRTKHRAKRLAEQLSKSGHRAVALQGYMSQSQRDRAMGGFRDRRFDILVATDHRLYVHHRRRQRMGPRNGTHDRSSDRAHACARVRDRPKRKARTAPNITRELAWIQGRRPTPERRRSSVGPWTRPTPRQITSFPESGADSSGRRSKPRVSIGGRIPSAEPWCVHRRPRARQNST
jgi:superfamily II DNA/RNA helicase